MQLDLLSWRELSPEYAELARERMARSAEETERGRAPDDLLEKRGWISGLQLNEIGLKRAKYQESRSLVREGTVGRHARYVIKAD